MVTGDSQGDGETGLRRTPDYVITLAAKPWTQLDEAQRRALLDHELSHCVGEEDPESGEIRWTLRGHDFEDFCAVVERHGAWTPSLEQLQGQLTLPGVDGPGEPVRRAMRVVSGG
jgi:hypothetical protein